MQALKQTPSDLESPAFLLNFPFTLSAGESNNACMEELKPEERIIDLPVAFKQFSELYNFIAARSITYLLPSEGNFQDQPYVANLGIVLPHLPRTVILSNYKSPPRRGEEKVGRKFFKMMGYQVYDAPHYFEGEADLKWIRDNIYFGGYGIRTDPEVYKWMTNKFDMNIIKVEMFDEKLYHQDCVLFPLDHNKVLLGTSVLNRKDINFIAKFAEIIDVPRKHLYFGATNCVRLGKYILTAAEESLEFLTKVCDKLNLEVQLFDLTEFYKSGAALSCLVLHLNRANIICHHHK